MFDLAETHCLTLLAQPLTPTGQTDIVLELLKTQTSRAILSSSQERETAWQKPLQTATQFLDRHPDHPRLILVQVQTGLTHLARGRLTRQEIEAELVPDSQQQQALNELRQAKKIFSQAEREIANRLPELRNRTLAADALKSRELLALSNNLRFQLAITNINLARLYPADDRLNRIDALNNVLDRLTEVLRRTSPEQPLWQQSQVLQIECLRLLGKLPQSQTKLKQLIERLETSTLPEPVIEQQLLLAKAMQDWPAAVNALQAAAALQHRQPTLDLARVQLLAKLSSSSDWRSEKPLAGSSVSGNSSDRAATWGLLGAACRTDFDRQPERCRRSDRVSHPA